MAVICLGEILEKSARLIGSVWAKPMLLWEGSTPVRSLVHRAAAVAALPRHRAQWHGSGRAVDEHRAYDGRALV